MPWLSYSDDEVSSFHPEFQNAADEALRRVGAADELAWIHHLRTSGNSIVPDFVLLIRATNQWLLSLEVKRQKDAVFSTRNQIQAKSYAELNQVLYPPLSPKYFAISNLEVTILSALNGNRPPRECQLQGGVFESGSFEIDNRENHKERFIQHMVRVVEVVRAAAGVQFDVVWPLILDELINYSSNAPINPQINIEEPRTPNWPLVRDFFSSNLAIDSSRVMFLRCLMAEYLRGVLTKHAHPQARRIPGLRPDLTSVANSIAVLRGIDFNMLFEAFAPDMYRAIQNDVHLRAHLIEYLASITDPVRRVFDLARTRSDAPALIDSLMSSLYPVEVQDESGKVQTDPELATILARLTIQAPVQTALDPCCGDGALMSGAYDYLTELADGDIEPLAAVAGIEVDAIATRLAEVRIALKQPATLRPQPPVNLIRGDLFANPQLVAQAQIILMNPPFLRYEEQQGRRIPDALRAHYNESIQLVAGRPATTTSGQANLYTYYVEFVIRAAATGTRIGIILDNRWYHNSYGKKLRDLLLKTCHIEAIVEYPHWAFFAHWTIATSLLILKKVDEPEPNHAVRFIRTTTDPRSVDLHELSRAFHGGGQWPPDWTCLLKNQRELRAKNGWKSFFSDQLENNYRINDWPILEDLFMFSRRGSLEKEGAGIEVYEFPFERNDYGPRRLQQPGRVGFQTDIDRELAPEENARLRQLASNIPPEYRGFVLRNADVPQHYELSDDDVQVDLTLEPPILREQYVLYLNGRTRWTQLQEVALAEMRAQPEVAAFIREVEEIVNLTEGVLPLKLIWNVLREPIAGELIIPRKTRTGHWVHLNSRAFDLNQRQVKISSNFFTYRNCVTDPGSGLTREISSRLVAAFLVSSFGHLQFEMEGYNREGCLALEGHQIERVRIFDPRLIRVDHRDRILKAFAQLPFPVSTDRLSREQPDRNRLDQLFAEEINNRHPEFDTQSLLDEVHASLDEWLLARQP